MRTVFLCIFIAVGPPSVSTEDNFVEWKASFEERVKTVKEDLSDTRQLVKKSPDENLIWYVGEVCKRFETISDNVRAMIESEDEHQDKGELMTYFNLIVSRAQDVIDANKKEFM